MREVTWCIEAVFLTVLDYFNLAFRFSFKMSHKYLHAYIALHSEVVLSLRFYATVS